MSLHWVDSLPKADTKVIVDILGKCQVCGDSAVCHRYKLLSPTVKIDEGLFCAKCFLIHLDLAVDVIKT